MKKITIIIIIILSVWGRSSGQELKTTGNFTPKAYYSFNWNTRFTLSDFNKWVASPSPAGFDFGGRYMIRKGLNAGFNLGWQQLSQSYGYETYHGSNGSAITATNYRITWMVPFQVTAGYMLLPEKVISPYFELGIGGDYMEHHLVIQEYDFYEKRWDFSLTPEIGAMVKFGYYQNWAALVAFNYKWTTNTIKLIGDDKSGQLQMLGLRIGLCYLVN